MCGIVGFVGQEDAQDILLHGLEKLEYRGYDSSGIAINNGEKINIIKSKGGLPELKKKLINNKLKGFLGIGHTRWATHGEPSDKNAHPHMSFNKKIAIVHNGIIENYLELKKDFDKNIFISDTDTEVIANLINKFYEASGSKKLEDFINAIYLVLDKIKGSYAIGIICDDFPDKLFALKKDNPLVIGIGENKNFIASDIAAVSDYTKRFYLLSDNEFAIIDNKNIMILDHDKNLVNKKVFEVNWDIKSAEKSGYEFFMLKEIFEQPKVINDFLEANLNLDLKINNNNNKDFLLDIGLSYDELKNFDRIYIIGCGTAYHAGLIAQSILSKLNIFVLSYMASEFRYNPPIINNKSLVIIISQSGETADSLAALKIAKKNNARVLSIINVMGSSIARESDHVIYINAGPEVSVASTKAFSLMLIAFYVLACYLYKAFNIISQEEFLNLGHDLKKLPALVNQILERQEEIEILANKYLASKNVFYIGRGLDYFISLEGSLKLKEIAYLYSQAYAAGELKHGPIALINNFILVIGIATQKNILEKTISNLKECKSRGAKIFMITSQESNNNNNIKHAYDDVFIIPEINQMFSPLLANIVLQLFAYYMAKGLGHNIDRPKNLAKSVTVE